MESRVERLDTDTETQEARAFLRERFLRFIAKLSGGENSDIIMQENIKVTGKLKGFDLDFENIIVENLATPFLPVKRAIMRSSDIISIHVKDMSNDTFTL